MSISISENDLPIAISTWKHGIAANEAAWKLLKGGKNSLDSVEAGVRVAESDPSISSVGYGGFPDRDGNVTLDASIMDWNGNCGSVGFLQHIKHPVSVARKVMEDTPYTMLCGDGALQFALELGFQRENLLTDRAEQAWNGWKNNEVAHGFNMNDHDTIGMLVIDNRGKIAGACTTSGLAWKLHGRVGDSPIIGAGLFINGDIGGATATGKGEAVTKMAGTAIIVELMRQGRTPQEACEAAINRIMNEQTDCHTFQVGFLALNVEGETGAFALQKGFQFAVHTNCGNKLIDSDYSL